MRIPLKIKNGNNVGQKEQLVCTRVDIFGSAVRSDGASAIHSRLQEIPGRGFMNGGAARRSALPLETSVPGVFGIGDARAGSTKRVAAAEGKGGARGADPQRVRRYA